VLNKFYQVRIFQEILGSIYGLNNFLADFTYLSCEFHNPFALRIGGLTQQKNIYNNILLIIWHFYFYFKGLANQCPPSGQWLRNLQIEI